MSESEDGSKGFRVTDRRKFTAEGQPRSDAEETSEEGRTASEPVSKQKPSTEPSVSSADSSPKPTVEEPEAPRQGPPPRVGFSDLVNMLASNALVQLGDAPDPVSGKQVANLPGAQVMIAFLETLQGKAKGNLSKMEESLLESVLYDLRMLYMTKANIIKS